MAHDDLAHDTVVQYVARYRYPFPDQTDWPASYETIANVPPQRGVALEDGTPHYPDIVIVDRDSDTIAEIGEVETMVGESLLAAWAAGADASKVHHASGRRHFFLYVPVGQADDAQRLMGDHRIDYGGVRTWEIVDGTIVITPITTPVDAKDHR